MRLLFCAAEQEELDCALQALRLHESQIAGKAQVDFMLTGIGTTSTCYRLTKKLVEAEAEGNPYALAVNIGIAGSYDLNAFPIGTTALIEKEYFGDLGFRTPSGFQTLFDSYALDANLFPFKDGTLQMTQLPDFFNDIADFIGVKYNDMKTRGGRGFCLSEYKLTEEAVKKYAPIVDD